MSETTAISQESSPVKPACKRKVGTFFIALLLLILISGLGFGYYQLGAINISLAKRVNILQQLINNQARFMLGMKNELTVLQQKQVSNQAMATQSLAEWQAAQKGDRNKWYVAEAQYLTRLANDHLQFTHDANLAIILLQRAQEILSPLQDNTVLEIRKALAANLADLQASPQINATDLYIKLSALDAQLDKLPLPKKPLQANMQQIVTTIPADWPWWKVGLTRTWEALRKIIVIHKQGSDERPLIFPEQETYLRDNLHTQMSQIIWAVLQRNPIIYQQGLNNITAWIKQYYVSDAAETLVMLQQLAELQKLNLQSASTDLVATLHLFDNYLAQNTQSQPAE